MGTIYSLVSLSEDKSLERHCELISWIAPELLHKLHGKLIFTCNEPHRLLENRAFKEAY